MPTESLVLAFGFHFDDLYSRDGMIRLDGAFLAALAEAAPTLHQQLLRARGQAPENVSQLILELAPYLEDFLAELFGITAELRITADTGINAWRRFSR